MKNIPLNICRFILTSILFAGILFNYGNGQAISGTKTIGTGGTYSTLTAAFSAATSSGINGAVIFELLNNYSSSGESFPITIGTISGSSATNTITIRPQTGATGLSIASANATATIDLNGATYLIIDGRPGGSGSRNLSIVNSNTTGLAIRFINEACYNTIKHTILAGQNTAPTGGVIFFGGTTGLRGNDSNVVDNCDIKDDGGNTPTTSVYSSGSTAGAAYYNSNNYITNCNISNFWNDASSEVNAFKISAGNTDWIITGNSMFQTSSRAPTSAFQLYFFNMNNNAANNHIMDNNYMGGTAPLCGGSPFTVNASVGFRITGCYLSVGSTVASSFSGNTFANFDITSGTTAYPGIPGVVSGPWLVGGLFKVNNNTFGSMTGTGSIKVTNFANGSCVYPIGSTSTTGGVIEMKNNKFGGIDVQGSNSSISSSLQCISITNTTSSTTYLIDSNTIGNELPENLICSTPTTSSTIQIVMGIYNASATANINARYNIIRNLKNNASGSGSGINYFTHGIDIGAGGTDTISNNQIYNLHNSALYQNNNTGSSAIIGIRLTPNSSGNVLSQNLIYGLTHTNNAASSISAIGIIINTMTNSRVDRNFIHSLSTNATGINASLDGINIGGGTQRVFNNMIRIGLDTGGVSNPNGLSIHGIVKITGSLSLLNNSVFIGGTGVASNAVNTFAYQSVAVGSDSIYNNIFSNVRSNTGTGGNHFAIGIAGSTGLIEDYNIFWANGNGGSLGLFNTTPISTIGSWYSTTGVDANSSNSNPGFKTPLGNYKTVDLHLSGTSIKGTPNSNLSSDFDNDIRNSPPDIGADEIPNDIGVIAIDSPTTANFCGRSRTIYMRFKNFGLTTVTAAQFIIVSNGNIINMYNWTGSLAPGITSGSIPIGAVNFTGGNYNLAIISNLPNNKLDNNLLNDTAKISFVVTPTVIPTLTISTANNIVCINTPVTFKAILTNGGTSPQLVWKLNGSVVGSNDTIYTNSALSNSDSITATLTSNAACANPSVVVSNQIKMTVGTTLPPTISINPNSNNVCPGTPISFKATQINGGSTPHYQWLKNGIPVGTDSSSYLLSVPANNDLVKCILTSNLSCASKPKDTSTAVVVLVNPVLVPTATISATATSICAGASDTFTVSVVNGGNNPVYQWRKNNNTVIGTNSNTYITTNLADNDSVYLNLISNALCANPTTVVSNKIGIRVNPTVTPAVTVTASKNNICTGDSVKLKASITNGGTNALLSWYKNSILLPNNTDSFYVKNIIDKDTFYLTVQSNATCLTQTTATSNKQVIQVNPIVTPSVSIQSTATTICAGTAVVFTATPVNGGSKPLYTWIKNNIIIGSDSNQLTTAFLLNNDSIQVVMVSNAACTTKASDTSARIKMTVNPTATPTIQISTPTPAFCSGSAVTFNGAVSNTGTNPHYQWYKNSIPFGPDSVRFTTTGYTDKDTVYAVLNSNIACATTNPVTSNKITLLMVPTVAASVSISNNLNNICKGTTVTFSTSVANAGTSPIFQWKINGINTGTSTASLLVDSLNNGDSVQVFMTSSAGCAVPAIAPSNKIGMVIKPLVTPKVFLTASANSVCMGQSITITAADSNGGTAPKHTWLNNSGVVGTDSIAYTSVYNNSQLIRCVLTSNIACASKTKDTASITVTVKPLPIRPVITRSADTLWSSVAASYQWARNNTDMPSETNRFHLLTQNGDYKVTIDSNGCKNFSNTFNVVKLALNQLDQTTPIMVFPNPTTGWVEIQSPFNKLETDQITLTDINGKTRQLRSNQIHISGNQVQLDLSDLPNGMYLLGINREDIIQYVKIIKQY